MQLRVVRPWLTPLSAHPSPLFASAIGDRILKSQGVIAEPEIRQWKISPADRYLVLASDGLWYGPMYPPRLALRVAVTAALTRPEPAGYVPLVNRDVLSNEEVAHYACATFTNPNPQVRARLGRDRWCQGVSRGVKGCQGVSRGGGVKWC